MDPYNELDHSSKGSTLMEHEHVSALMGQLRRFARAHGVHVWLVAHPRQLQQWHGEVKRFVCAERGGGGGGPASCHCC